MFVPKYSSSPLYDDFFIEDAKKIVSKAYEKGIVLRILGAVAIRIHSMDYADLHKKLGRLGREKQTFSDIDFIAYGKQRNKIVNFFEKDMSYIVNRYIMLGTLGKKRHIYYHPKSYYYIDVFFDRLEFSHDIPLKGRLELDNPTIPLADLVLEKIQIHQINEKDIKDLIVLLRAHEISETDKKETINAKYIAKILADDWGFWYDATKNMQKVKFFTKKYYQENLIDNNTLDDIFTKIDKILEIIEKEPKTRKWKKREKIGIKKKWYKEVEEIVR